MLKKIFVGCLILIMLLIGGLVAFSFHDRRGDNGVSSQGVEIPKYTELEIDFRHSFIRKRSLPFMAAAIIDVDNDGSEEIFIGGGVRQSDGLFRLKDGQFSDISGTAGLVKLGGEASYGSVVLDVDGNGYSDLIIARDSGVWLYLNMAGVFTGKNLNLSLEKNTVPVSVALCDINRDGFFDMYVSGHVKLSKYSRWPLFFDSVESGKSGLFLNNGDNTFRDISSFAGLDVQGNGYQGVFVDIDSDGLEDLVTTQSGGPVRSWKNLDNLSFQEISNPNTSEKSFPVGIGVGDINNDGQVDFFFSNIGSTFPSYFAQKMVGLHSVYNPNWIVFQNKGDHQFEDVGEKLKLNNFELAQGALLEDLNLDGRVDLVVSENSAEWPLHEFSQLRLFDRMFLQTEQGTYTEVSKQAGFVNQSLGTSPLVADLNGDGGPDLVFMNLGGKPKVYLNKISKNRYLKVKLPDRVESLGAVVVVETLKGATLYKHLLSGEGLCTDQSHILLFGLGDDTAVNVEVMYLNKESQRVSGEMYNSTVTF